MGNPERWALPALHDLSDDTVLSTNMNYCIIYQHLILELTKDRSCALCRLRSRQDADMGRPSTSVVPSV
jgi:hypothetical protein